MKYLKRETSIITREKSLELLFELKAFPTFIGCTSSPKSDDVFADMVWMICKDSGMIQLERLLPPQIVYSEYHSEAIGSIWRKHHEEFSDFISKHYEGNILEIGGSNGELAKIFQSKESKKTPWTIIEPNPSFKGDNNIKVVESFYDESTSLPNIKTIIHSHVLEHLNDPNVLFHDINSNLSENGKHLFSIPNLYQYLKKKYSNSINFEHTFFLTEYFTDYLLKKHNFKIIEKYKYEHHSIFYATEKDYNAKTPSLKNKYKEYKKLYLDMVKYYDQEVVRLNQLMDSFSGEIYLFGAHIFSQFLIYRGLNQNKIKGIIDNSQMKENKRLYGTELIVCSPIVISDKLNTAVILKAGQYQNEVKKQLVSIKTDVEIWE